MLTPGGRIRNVHLMSPNPSLFSPRGFRPRVPDTHLVMEVTADNIWDRQQLRAVRAAALVRLHPPVPREVTDPRPQPGAALSEDHLTAQAALALTMAAVPVEGASLTDGARALLDPELLRLLDLLTPDVAADPARREDLCLRLRRRAWSLYGFPRAPRGTVLVLLPEHPPPLLLADLGRQAWPSWVPVPVPAAADDQSQRQAVSRAATSHGAVYVTRLDPCLRYGPHHLGDLVHALQHSGASVAHSPARFWPWEAPEWLEDDQGVERPARHGLPGGSLWYASDGHLPPGPADGYAVHGCNAVPLAAATPTHVTAWRLHPDLPPALAWLCAD